VSIYVGKGGLCLTVSSGCLAALFTLCAPRTASGANCVPPPSGLVSWWRAEGDALDVIGGNNGVLDHTGFAPGLVGQAFAFNGVSAAVLVGDAPNLNFTNQ
jgi:hypothetical protein